MAKKAYVGVSGTPKNVKAIYVGVNGVPKKVIKGYVGVNGVPCVFWDGGDDSNFRVKVKTSIRNAISPATIPTVKVKVGIRDAVTAIPEVTVRVRVRNGELPENLLDN